MSERGAGTRAGTLCTQAVPWSGTLVCPGYLPRLSTQAAGLCSALACDSLRRLNCNKVAVATVELLSLSTASAASSSTEEITAE